ncbi:2-C-methyl-D-erythritol 2,4-cyclodiphosphate synthase [Oceanotoga sp. DSM 15011]|uniref:2-C-methyl-D-erythritol 2,4-cyclodiphosphate synthase n=1 Tax=Oceanotoga sp. DSM 15011 TaxID=2984951 RepID=UPI0021F4C730|nr:2-C-methyl-D-erythritol 2,4-cyclodiphosphate synthase [Oceanotoga sp. DSM 15011]UYP01121.1 2-C-methyl-D-erythritol 2,4-cyclodiphosphate synthase [Oceanotoga sp. DSM 15011]
MLKVGFGYDVHALVKGRKLILGGLDIKHPNDLGLSGHSDADVLLHALIDSLISISNYGSIGELFPENKENKDISSLILLEKTVKKLNTDYILKINNIDITVISKSIRITEIRNDISKKIEKILKIKKDQINIKGKSGNSIGNAGNDKAIETYCVILAEIQRRDNNE